MDRLVAFLERDRLPLFLTFLYVLAVAFVRDMLEYYLLDQEFVSSSHPWIYSIAHHLGFYVVVFMGLVLLLSAFSGRGVRRSINYVSCFYWIIILPPILDHYIGGLNENYAYFSVTDFLNAIFHFSGEGFHIGQATEVFVVLFALFAYTIWTQRHRLFTIRDRTITLARILLLIFFTFLAMFIMATPAAFLPVAPTEFPSFDLTKYYQFHIFLFFYYLAAGVMLSVAITYLATKGHFRYIVRSMRPVQTLFFGAIVAAGIVTGWRLSSSLDLVTKLFQNPYWVNLGFAGISIIAALLAWQVSTIWNDLSDRESDEPRRKDRILASGLVHMALLKQVSLILVTVSVTCSFLLSIPQGLIILGILALSFIYSFRPVRFKDHILSPVLIGLGTFLAFIYGYLTPYSEVDQIMTVNGPVPFLTGAVKIPALTPEGFLLGFFMFIGLAVGSMVTDIDGYEEDRKARVKTIFTYLGLEKGKRIVAVLIFLSALTPLFLFDSLMDLVVFPFLGAAAAIIFIREGRSRPVLVIALVGLVYAAMRYLGLI